MPTSRRDILLQGCAIGAGVIASSVAGIVALAQAQPPLRRSLHGMASNDPILQAWRDGVRLLKAQPASNPVSWANFAAIHGSAAGFNICPHGNWYFLPWHRAYLVSYERAVRQLTGHDDFALPYWDWTQDRQMPAAFVDPMFDGKPNALFETQRDASPMDSLPDTTVGPAVISQILTEAPFETFGTSRPVGQNDLNQAWLSAEFSGTSGTLEGTPHNLVHVFVGGIMGQANSALDPLFMMHHCNIDRLWWLWNQAGQADSPDPLWVNMPMQNNFFNPDGTPYSPMVAELLAPEPLGYTYATAPSPVSVAASGARVASATVAAQFDKLKSLYAIPNLTTAKAAGITAYVGANTLVATTVKHLDIPVEVSVDDINTVARRTSTPSGEAMFNLGMAREAAVTGPRAYAFIRDIEYAEQGNTEYRVFINCDYLSPATPATDRHYVGSFGFFGRHDGHGGHEARKPSISVDLTSALQRVFGASGAATGRIKIQVQPVALRPKDKASGTAKPSRVEIAFVSG